MDADEKYWEKSWREQHKNALSYIEQIMETISHEKSSCKAIYHLSLKPFK